MSRLGTILDYRDRFESKLDHLHELVHTILERMDDIMATAAEVSAKLDTAMQKLTANTDAFAGISQFIADIRTQLMDVQAQLDALIASGASDPAAMQELSDKVDALVAATDAQAVAEAALTNAPAPAPAPAP